MNKLIEKKNVVTEIRYIQDDFEFYAQLYEEFHTLRCKTEKEIWSYNKIIQLMENLRFSVNREFVTNALVLIITLFNEEFNNHKDTVSKNTANLSEDEKKEFFAVLKGEIIVS